MFVSLPSIGDGIGDFGVRGVTPAPFATLIPQLSFPSPPPGEGVS